MIRQKNVDEKPNQQAEATVNAANEDAEQIRRAWSITAELIDNLQTVIGRTLEVAKTNYDGLLDGLSYNMEILNNNREALGEQLDSPAEPFPYMNQRNLKSRRFMRRKNRSSKEELTDDGDIDEDDYDDID